MSGVTREQINHAKQIDILDYLLHHEPNNIKRIGNAHYLKDHDSLEISNGLWNWHSRDIGGKNVIDYLIKVRGYSFVDAVRHLDGDNAIPCIAPNAKPPPKVKDPFHLPPRNGNHERAITYLQNRGIDKRLILSCIKYGILYESAGWHNCVFVGKDENDKAQYASIRGITGSFKYDANNSDKRFGFILPPKNPNSDTVIIFESAIDTLSHKTLYPDFDAWRLSLGGTALVPLIHFLECHHLVKKCIICTDNDRASNLMAEKIMGLTGISATRSLPSVGKDWNDQLIQIRNGVKILDDKRKDIRFIDSNYKTLFHIKDGDSIKITISYDGEVVTRKCRWIDEMHTEVGINTYHICEFAERMEKVGNQYKPADKQECKIDILFAKYDGPLQNTAIPMTEAAIKQLIGDTFSMEYLNSENCNSRCALLRGTEGAIICGIVDGTPTSIHPYWAQKYKRELSPVGKLSETPSLLHELKDAKTEADVHNNKSVNTAMISCRNQVID